MVKFWVKSPLAGTTASLPFPCVVSTTALSCQGYCRLLGVFAPGESTGSKGRPELACDRVTAGMLCTIYSYMIQYKSFLGMIHLEVYIGRQVGK